MINRQLQQRREELEQEQKKRRLEEQKRLRDQFQSMGGGGDDGDEDEEADGGKDRRGYAWEQKFKLDLLEHESTTEEDQRIQKQLQEERRKRARTFQNKNYLVQGTMQLLASKSSANLAAMSSSASMSHLAEMLPRSDSTLSLPGAAGTSGMEAPVSIIRKGIIRYMYLIIDMSRGILQPMEHGLRTPRLQVVRDTCSDFIREYFDQNPLSQMGFIATRNSIADECCELTGSDRRLLESVQEQFQLSDSVQRREKRMDGDPSLQNALKLGLNSLKQIPSYGSKEILIVYSSLSTCDPGDIFETIKELRMNNVRCSVVSLDAEMHVLKCIAKETNGEISVPLNVENFKECMFDFASPPPITTKQTRATTASLIRMGFPQKKPDSYFSFCACHQEVRPGGYICPRCKSKYCELPTECKVCGLTLVSSPHLARSYHHLFPVKPFIELSESSAQAMSIPEYAELTTQKQLSCFSCMKQLPKESTLRLLCLQCQKVFCVECDSYIHNDIHNCPGCDVGG